MADKDSVASRLAIHILTATVHLVVDDVGSYCNTLGNSLGEFHNRETSAGRGKELTYLCLQKLAGRERQNYYGMIPSASNNTQTGDVLRDVFVTAASAVICHPQNRTKSRELIVSLVREFASCQQDGQLPSHELSRGLAIVFLDGLGHMAYKAGLEQNLAGFRKAIAEASPVKDPYRPIERRIIVDAVKDWRMPVAGIALPRSLKPSHIQPG